MIAMDLARFAAMMTIPLAYAFGRLSFVQLLGVSAVVATAKIAFNAASGACLRALVRPDDLLVANARFESTTWSSIAVGPPLGGAAIGLFGPVTTVTGRRAQLPVLRAGDHRHPRPGRTAAANRREPGPGQRTARRLAAHPDPARPAGALPQQLARRRTDNGHRAAAGRAAAPPARVPALAVRPRLRRPLRRRAHRLTPRPPGRGTVRRAHRSSASSARCARSG